MPPDEIPGQPPSFPVVGIGASAGGVEAFSLLLRALDPDAGMAYVFVLHMNPSHHSLLGEILSRATPMQVHEVSAPAAVRPDNVYVVGADSELTLKGAELRPVKRPKERGTPERSTGSSTRWPRSWVPGRSAWYCPAARRTAPPASMIEGRRWHPAGHRGEPAAARRAVTGGPGRSLS